MKRAPAILLICAALFAGAAASLRAEDKEDVSKLPPYKMVRTLQSIQDAVINGDIDSVEMQRFLLGEIDKRLLEAKSDIFDDPRNVDAALIYAMSGGNPKTLDVIAERDVDGYFDNRVTSILRRYLSGRGATAAKQLKEVVPEYRGTRIGPYLELIGANALMEKDPATALTYFDWARLEAPGSIVEEAALRRSLNLTSRNGQTDRALLYARKYARRYMTSPYASQFADIFVGLAMDHPDALPPDEIEAVLSLIERTRQREIYLRLARRAAIAGNKPLADFASENAKGLSRPEDKGQLALADLYSGIVNVPTEGVDAVLERLAAIPDDSLTPKDRFLRDAARVIAEEVIREPDKVSLTQEKAHSVEKATASEADPTDPTATDPTASDPHVTDPATEAKDPAAAEPTKEAATAEPPADAHVEAAADEKAGPNQKALDTAIGDVQTFVTSGQDKLKEIDKLLSAESN